MGLTDVTTLVTASIVALVLFVVTVAVTPRLTAPVVGVVTRAALVLLTAVGLLVVVGLKLNDDNGWYVSWNDLRGPDDTADVSNSGAVAGAAAGDHRAKAAQEPAPTTLPPLPDPGRRVQAYDVTGTASGLHLPVSVVLPRSYESSPQKRYPVIVAFHGYPGTPSGWTKTMGVMDKMDEAVAQHRMAEAIIVVPQINTPLGRDGECVDGPKGTPQLETWLMKDAPGFARTHLRTATDRSGWAAAGYSAGAYCAAVAGILHPDTFGAAVVMGGYFRPDFSGGAPVVAPGSAAAERYDLLRTVATSPPTVALWIQAGKQSPYWPQMQQLQQLVRPPMSVTAEIQPDAGHRWDVWKAKLPDALTWLGANIPGFRPGD